MDFTNLEEDEIFTVADEEIAKCDTIKKKISALLEQEISLIYAYEDDNKEGIVITHVWSFKENTIRFHEYVRLKLRVTFIPESEPIFEVAAVEPNGLDYYSIYSWEEIEDTELDLVIKRMESISRFWKEEDQKTTKLTESVR